MKASHWYFAYGSNMSRARLEARVGPCEARGHAWLEGFDLRFHKRGRDGSGKCDAFATGTRAHALHGVLFGMSAAQREALHVFEGPGYAVSTLEIAHAGGALEAFLYVARRETIDPALLPYDWYKAFVCEGAVEARLPPAYQARLAAQAADPDPDDGRARANRALLTRGAELAANALALVPGDAENSCSDAGL